MRCYQYVLSGIGVKGKRKLTRSRSEDFGNVEEESAGHVFVR